MNFFRLLFTALIWALVLSVVLAIAAFVPAIQTWALGLALDRDADVHGSVGQIAAAFGKVETDNLQLQFHGAELSAPLIVAELPILPAVGRRQYHFRHLTAKGWTLTLHPAADADPTPEPPDLILAQAIGGLLSGGPLPYDVQVDSAELEGDLVIAGPKGKSPSKVHIVLNGGGLSPGHPGDFAIEAGGGLADPNLPLFAVATHGQLLVTLGSSRLLSRIELKAGLTAKGATLQQDLQLVGDFAASRGPDSVGYSVDLTSRGRRFVGLAAQLAPKTGQVTGTWRVDLRDTDLALFSGDRDLPVGSAAGEGRFEANPARTEVRAIGGLKIAARHLETIAPALAPVSSLVLDTTFDVTHLGHSLRVDQLTVNAAADHPLGSVKIAQAFTVDEATWDYKPTDARGDWATGTVRAIPLAWLPTDFIHGLTVTGGNVEGAWVARTVPGGFRIKSVTPLTAKGIELKWNGAAVARGIDLSAVGSATHIETGWQWEWTPLTVSSGSAVLGHLTAHVTPPGEGESMSKATGKWDLDVAALLPLVDPATRTWLGAARSASADFTGSVGMGAILDSNLTVVGSAPEVALTVAPLHTEIGADGSSSFNVPLKLKTGTVQSDLTVEGTWSGALSGSRLRLKLFGGTVVAEQMQGLAGWWAQRLIPSGAAAAGLPMWGAGRGSVLFSCDHFLYQGKEYKDVSGTIEYEPTGLILEDGHVRFGDNHVTDARGKLSFNPAAPVPYELAASAPLGDVTAKQFFPKPLHDDDPLLEGRFSVNAALASRGRDRDQLLQNLREVFHLSSQSGIVRLLKISVADVIPQHASNVADTLGGVGNTVGSFLGMEGRIGSGKNPVTPAAQNMVDFSYDIAEIGYDQLSLTAVRRPDGTLELHDIKLVAPDETITGSGLITAQPNSTLMTWPLSLDWELSFHGHPAELLAKAKLLTYKKDAPGYVLLSPRIHVGGTLEHPDLKQWHDILAKAASVPAPKK